MPQIPSKHAPGPAASPAAAIRALPVPAAAPPYDDEPAPVPPAAGPPAAVPAARGPQPAPAPAAGPAAAPAGAPAWSPGPGPWPGQFAQILAETLAGARPQLQLVPWTTEQARRRIRQLGPALATRQQPRVRRIMTSAPAPGVLELTAVVGFGARTRVLAVRLERRPGAQGRWRCTAIDTA